MAGRKANSKNQGYWYRSGRGWVVTQDGRTPYLCDELGHPMKDRNRPKTELKAAYHRYLEEQSRIRDQEIREIRSIKVSEACSLFLQWAERNRKQTSYQIWERNLYDFCTGFPFSCRDMQGSKELISKMRIHQGFGEMQTCDLLPKHLDQWINAHPNWDGARYVTVRSVKRMMNYCLKAGHISQNHLRSYKEIKQKKRLTYITPEVEEAMCELASDEFRMALKFCIRTGARHGCEFSKITAGHITETPRGIEIKFSPQESKNNKLRVIRVVDPEIVEMIQQQKAKHPTGPIFRQLNGKPWQLNYLSSIFRGLLKKIDMDVEENLCMYSCRHTYAKRILNGYWSGKTTNIEILSELMGNSRKICWETYGQFCEAYSDPLWDNA